jgi:hypothetical protein
LEPVYEASAIPSAPKPSRPKLTLIRKAPVPVPVPAPEPASPSPAVATAVSTATPATTEDDLDEAQLTRMWENYLSTLEARPKATARQALRSKTISGKTLLPKKEALKVLLKSAKVLP